MPHTASWRVALDVAQFADVEQDIDRFLAEERVDGRAGYVSRLVVEEVVLNLIEHTPHTERDAAAEIRIDVTERQVIVVVEDTRPPFDPSDAPELDVGAPLEQRRDGGMGLHLVRNLTDELRYERIDERNRLTAVVARG